uniref:Uncharacterized protein n=1 Tax=Setaria italica TaxID=4555 RepID=K3XUC8_SETIT
MRLWVMACRICRLGLVIGSWYNGTVRRLHALRKRHERLFFKGKIYCY